MAKCSPKYLLELSKEEQLAFLESFDTVFCDVDGVVWNLGLARIDGASEGIRALRNLGKKLFFITNNSTVPLNVYMARMKPFDVVKEEIIRPTNALIWYLKKCNFDKEVYVLSCQALKDELRDAGFKVIYDEITPLGETPEEVQSKLREIRPEVEAVIVDFVVNMDYMSLQKCVEYIKKNNAMFLIGASDPIVPYNGTQLIGSSHFARAIEEVTGVSPKVLSKPGIEFTEVLEENIGPYDPKRILFIGDSPVTDMIFATNNRYQKLLPFTGYTTEEDLKNWKNEEKYKPDYVVESIKVFHTIVSNLGLNKPKL